MTELNIMKDNVIENSEKKKKRTEIKDTLGKSNKLDT